ncbi:hypothetical protein LCGC14_1556330 [marine sediment metagenome]|uniref:Phage head-tail adaptor n=1 Tax=marine sediment metagenome TaxID=412755 RepID=A0A0F9L533_9ZZZZ
MTIQKLDGTLDAAGVENQTWVDVATVRAAIEPLRGDERFTAQQEVAQVTTRIRMRFLKDSVVAKMRVQFIDLAQDPDLTRLYDILAVINVGQRDREMHLMCKETV